MVSGNGHAGNGENHRGQGGPYTPTHKRVRAGLAYLQRSVRDASNVSGHELQEAMDFALSILHDESRSARDRLRAAELVDTLVGRCAGLADRLEHYERLDEGEVTERTGYEVDIPRVRD